MELNQAALAAVYKSFKTIFNEAFQGVAPEWEKIAMPVPSSTGTEEYGWLGAFPKLREWIGDRHVKNLQAHGYSIKNKDWEASVAVNRNSIEDDTYGVYRPFIAEMGRSSAAHYDELSFAMLPLGLTALCYDGQYFFDTDHPVGAGVVSNYGGGAGAAWYLLDTTRAIKPIILQKRKPAEFVSLDRATDENVFMRKEFIYGVDCRDNAGFGLWQLAYASKQTLDATNYAAARAAMMSFKDDEGKPLGIKPNLLVVPPTLEGNGRAILLNERDDAGATNSWRATAELLVTPWL